VDETHLSGGQVAGLRFSRVVLHPALTVGSAVCLLAMVGWSGAVETWQHWLTCAIGLVFGMERAWVFRVLRPQGRDLRRLPRQLALAAMVFPVSLLLLFQKQTDAGSWSLGGHVFVQLCVLISGIASMIHHQTRLTARAMHPGRLLMGSFLAAILAGTLLLKMPRCVGEGESLSWVDALFTSTSAICVTGLVVENTATFFTPTGQVILLLLIQIGGLGIMTLTFFAAAVLFENLSLHDRLLLGKMIHDRRLSRIGHTLAFIVIMTFVFEAVGALVLFLGMGAETALAHRVFQSVFHSVSAFCNAGFSTLHDGLADGAVHGNHTWQICIMTLIVVGGLGALVVEDLAYRARAKLRRWSGHDVPPVRLRIHTRLVLTITAVLIAGGTLLIYATEFLFADGPANGGQFLTALFHSITARTAGFNTVPMDGIAPLTVQLLILLMIIGGSPGGTAGGLRTTVVAVGLGHLWCQLRAGKRGMIAFHRAIPPETGARALGLIVLAAVWLGSNFILLQFLQRGDGISETHLLFELVSAFATVGLSLDDTGALNDGAKLLLVLNMFVGRIGLLTVMATMIPRDTRPASGKPREDVFLT